MTSEGVRSEGELLNPDHVINIELLQNQDHSILLSQVSEKWKWIAWTNPMSVPVEALRITLLGRGTLGITEVVISLMILVTDIALFQRVKRTVVDFV